MIENSAVFGQFAPAPNTLVDAGAALAYKRGRDEAIAEMQPELKRLRLSTANKSELLLAKMTELTSTKCGNCDRYFVDFTGCFAIQCKNDSRGGTVASAGMNYCEHYTCGWCFSALGNMSTAAHIHVATCPRNKVCLCAPACALYLSFY